MSESSVGYVYAQVVRGRAATGCRVIAPHDLRAALPNHTYVLPGSAPFRFGDVALVGKVTAAEKGPAFAHAGDDVLVPVDFDDPSVAERTALVHVAVDESWGDAAAPRELTFQMGLHNADNAGLFIEGLSSMGPVAVILTRRDKRGVKLLVPAEQGALIGRIDGADRLRFPGLGDDEDEFVGGITSGEAFRRAASQPSRRVFLERR